MTSALLTNVANVVRSVLKKTTAEPFVYWSGHDPIPVNATLTNPDPVLLAASGVLAEGVEHYDLLVDPTEMVFAGEQREPSINAEMVSQLQDDGSYRCWSSVHRGDRQVRWRWTDGAQIMMRIFLVEIARNTPFPVRPDVDIADDATEDADG